jgi:hypothetical protein
MRVSPNNIRASCGGAMATRKHAVRRDRFTVMSLARAFGLDLDGSAGGSGDEPALAADWDRKWLIPSGTNAWFPVKVFNDVALSGEYTLALSGSSNVVAHRNGTVVRGGGTAAVSFPQGSTAETVEVQAEGAGNATLTVSFRGSGSLTNYTCATSVDVTALGVEVKVAAPGSAQWEELEERRVVLSDEDLRIKIMITPKLDSLSHIFAVFGSALSIRTSGTAPDGRTLVLNAQNTEFAQQPGRSELRIAQTRSELRALGVLPGSESDLVEEKAWLDTGPPDPAADSNLSDGIAFDSFAAEPRGRCTSDGNLESPTENSPVHLTFFQAAGREIITAEFAGSASRKRQIMNQADYFYCSGHGSHATGGLAAGSPSALAGYWNQDLDCAVIAGCSVLDINDYNGNYTGTDHAVSPGKTWEPLGPLVLLGYNWYAPTDTQGAAAIISSWLASRASLGNAEAWRVANENSAGWNACVIRKGVSYAYYKRITVLGFSVQHEWTTVLKTDW